MEGKIIKKPLGFSSKSEIRGLCPLNREGTLTVQEPQASPNHQTLHT